MLRHLVSIDDLADAEVALILDRAAAWEDDKITTPAFTDAVVGLLFQQTSLRTRVGYAVASAKLGWHAITINERRHDPTSMIESWADTLRTLSGYFDVLVARPGEHLPREVLAESLTIPYINGGGVGPNAEHPSQALIDVFAMERNLGPVSSLAIGICGDLRMRSARSLLRLLARRLPKRLILVTVPELDEHIPAPLSEVAEYRPLTSLDDVDVLYVVGMPHRAVSEEIRDTLRVTQSILSGLPAKAIVLSPLPIIDEIDGAARSDQRLRMYQQSDSALFVRMALLELLVKEV